MNDAARNRQDPESKDPILYLRMPGCFIAGANLAANLYFRRYGNIDLQHPAGEYLGSVFHGPGVLLSDYCPFEQAYQRISAGHEWGPALAAFHFGHANGKRYYKLFVIHALDKQQPRRLSVRMVPLPESSFEVIVEDCRQAAGVRAYTEHSELVPVDAMSREDSPARNRLARAEVIFAKLAAATSAANAWRELPQQDVCILPPYVVHLFRRHAGEMLRQTLAGVLRHPLDAVLLGERILPGAWTRIRNDRELRYLPSTEQEQLQYLRARLPLRELEEQDRYLHWLPLPDDWDRDLARDDLYSL